MDQTSHACNVILQYAGHVREDHRPSVNDVTLGGLEVGSPEFWWARIAFVRRVPRILSGFIKHGNHLACLHHTGS